MADSFWWLCRHDILESDCLVPACVAQHASRNPVAPSTPSQEAPPANGTAPDSLKDETPRPMGAKEPHATRGQPEALAGSISRVNLTACSWFFESDGAQCGREDGHEGLHARSPRCAGCGAEMLVWLRSATVHVCGKCDHFDPTPPPKAPAIDGWVYCEGCEKPQPATGHECHPKTSPHPDTRHCPDCGSSPWFMGANGVWEFSEGCDVCATVADANFAEDRAEFAESLLCALSWDHAIDLDNGWVECGPCVYCDAAREGGR